MAGGLNYPRALRSTRKVGRTVATVIDYLVTTRNVSLDQIHIIGHSLGAHAAGFSGMYTTTGKVGRITGMDPAGPGFYV